jgi:hypothetical protein
LRRLRLVVATVVLGGALTAQHAVAASTSGTTTKASGTTTTSTTGTPATTTTTPSTTTTTPSTTTTTTPSTTTTTVAPTTGVTVSPTPVAPPRHPKHPGADNGNANQGADGGKKPDQTQGQASKQGKKGNSAGVDAGAPLAPGVPNNLGPLVPGPSCGVGISPPAALMPIYEQASNTYGLGPQGPSVLAAINGIESGFGANLGPSSAGAEGWMQFMPSTWAVYGVDANGDGKADPNDPQDAIFAAARYLQAAGMPVNTPSAIFSYNHADWYVQEVLASAACYGSASGLSSPLTAAAASCQPAQGSHIPEVYMSAFEDAATRYDLGQRGIWALAAVARLESNFGRGMDAGQLVSVGPLGLDRDEWNRFEVDGDGNGRIDHADIYDSAATLAREFWSQGDLRSGIFLHNQAEWYVQQVLAEADQVSGKCTPATGFATWSISMPQSSIGSMGALVPGQLTPWDTTVYDGKEVCSYMVPILDAARQAGWQGQVVSGYRTYAEQVAIHASGVFSAKPGESNHEGCAGLTYGSGNGAVDVSDPPGFAAAMAQLGNPLRNTLGAVDPEHFSPGGN